MKIVSASLSPNTNAQDVWRALFVLVTPWTWKRGKARDRVTQWFRDHYQVSQVNLYQSGRVALYEILKSFHIGAGDEVLVQAFTCVAVPNSVRWAGASPIYADIDDSLNIDSKDIVKKVTAKTKAIIVQHTFGIPADMKAVMKVAKKHKLLVIEDCAHAIGGEYEGKKLGMFGDAAFFSFGRDKAISSVWGGAAFLRNRRISSTHLSMPGYYWIFQQLLHPIAFSLILETYTLGIGKVFLVLLQRLHLLSKPVVPIELRGGMPKGIITEYPNALAQLLEIQLAKLPEMIRTRQKNAQYFEKNIIKNRERIRSRDGATYLRYPVLVDKPADYRIYFKKYGILLGNWYHNVIDPKGTDFTLIGYTRGSCPHAESKAAHILNFPTLISKQDADRIVAVLC